VYSIALLVAIKMVVYADGILKALEAENISEPKGGGREGIKADRVAIICSQIYRKIYSLILKTPSMPIIDWYTGGVVKNPPKSAAAYCIGLLKTGFYCWAIPFLIELRPSCHKGFSFFIVSILNKVVDKALSKSFGFILPVGSIRISIAWI